MKNVVHCFFASLSLYHSFYQVPLAMGTAKSLRHMRIDWCAAAINNYLKTLYLEGKIFL
jgi:hypothetical protein